MMDGGKIGVKRTVHNEAYGILHTNLSQLCINVARRSKTDTCSLLDFATDNSMFWVTMAQLMQNVSNTVVIREQKDVWG